MNVSPVSLPYLKLNIPGHVGRRAKNLILQASSAVPATLIVGRLSFKLTGTPTPLSVPVKPGRGPLLLTLTASANGIVTPFAAEVTRTG